MGAYVSIRGTGQTGRWIGREEQIERVRLSLALERCF